ncbi:MAG: hypothetical protein P1V35_10595 [Planctomycetota bacterium]|nr:hypothetical protein [Planctomycetota bacterium]
MKQNSTKPGCRRAQTLAWVFGLLGMACQSEPDIPDLLAESAQGDKNPVHLKESSQYEFSSPDRTFLLPAELTEVSALTDLGDNTVASVQDELGVIFVIDTQTGGVVHRLPFGGNGDYEGLTRVGEKLWVLRSDGMLMELTQDGSQFRVEREVVLHIEHVDCEGLGYHPKTGMILVAPKDRPNGSKEDKDRRRVFALDPATGQLQAGFALDTSKKRIVREARALGIDLPTRKTKKDKEKVDIKVQWSSIAVHPSTGRFYALSAVDDALYVFDKNSRLVQVEFFAGTEMPQLEGMTFLRNGDLVVVSEGRGGPSRMQVFVAQPRDSE